MRENNSVSPIIEKTVFPILFALSFSHLLNDTIQSLIPAIYPVIKSSYGLSFSQIGLITLTFQMAASLLQPFVGLYTDKKPQPYSLAVGMGFTLIGLITLSQSAHFYTMLISVAFIGIGSSIFHPEASRMAHAASGEKRGLAQSVFQLGGNAGSSLGPLLAAWIIVPYGQFSVIWFSAIALLAIVILSYVGNWYRGFMIARSKKTAIQTEVSRFSRNKVIFSVVILLLLIFSKYFYMASLTNYFTFYLIHKFKVSVQTSQIYLFVFLFSVAAGTLLGGPIGDKVGRKYVIWASILGTAPFALLLPHANLFWIGVLIVPIGMILASAFSAILVYAQELIPGKVGLVAGLFFGFAFGMGGIGSALLGKLADSKGIEYVFSICAFLPLIGLLTGFLPNIETRKK
ncbi:FSR family fosmidomycin resistance protein-like MFS transporter [Pedobacter psychrotolerans]|uniref:Fosmidomycin resistance protein n=1 Tax=Pedobacter psychrotolerans TaxID=1843235 RepID=A0A4R2HDD0_9SPHI|nr:MFS transporter [Pedobacter psychrotolerans]TCO25492.1 FSR family fosmidomycin resistance protein-like MFS transporter [Pedobacter psychrotolerans]GGE45039.1 fosmidomycin resistance protein [Pedobacter psychrotolerans]